MCSRSRSRSKVTWYGHFWFHENRFFSQANGWNATKLAHDGSQPGLLAYGWIATKLAHPQISLHPGCAQGQGRGQRSWYGHFSDVRKIASSCGQMAGQTCTRWFPIWPASRVCWTSRSMSKVTLYWHFVVLKVKVEVQGYVIGALLWFHKNCFFSPWKWLDYD